MAGLEISPDKVGFVIVKARESRGQGRGVGRRRHV